jgi:hypothetical protein
MKFILLLLLNFYYIISINIIIIIIIITNIIRNFCNIFNIIIYIFIFIDKIFNISIYQYYMNQTDTPFHKLVYSALLNEVRFLENFLLIIDKI